MGRGSRGKKASAAKKKQALQKSKAVTGGGGNLSPSQKAGSSKAGCPYAAKNTDVPCDVKSVRVKDSVSGTSVKCDVTASRRPSRKSPKGLAKRRLMDVHDWVMEIVSAPIVEGGEDKSAKIVLEHEWVGDCPEHIHPAVKFSISNPDPEEDTKAPDSWSQMGCSSESVGLPPKSMPIDSRNRLYVADLLELFRFREEKVKLAFLEVASCGVRTSGKPNGTISGLIRVYRLETCEVSLTIPAFKKMEYSLEESVELKRGEGQWKKEGTSTETRENWSASRKTTGRKDGKDSLEFTDKTGGITMEYGQSTSFTTRDSGMFHEEAVKTDSKGEAEHSFKIKPKFSIKRNGAELDVTEVANKILEVILGIKHETLKLMDDLQKVVPKAGLYMTLEAAFFEGTISLQAGTKPDGRVSSPEYVWVGSYCEISVKVYVVRLKFIANAGVEVSSPGILNWFGGKVFEVICKLALEISLDLSLECKKSFGAEDLEKEQEWTVTTGEADSTAKIFFQFRAAVAGYAVDAEAGVEAGFTAGASLVMPFNLKYKIDRKAGVIYARFNYPGKGKPSPRWEYILWPTKKGEEAYLLESKPAP